MFEQKIRLLDGAMGTLLQAAGMELGERPEMLSLKRPELVESIHHQYVQAGSDIILTNTFGANARKLSAVSPETVIASAVSAAKRASAGTAVQIALDIGPIGELLEPFGALRFEDAYALFAQMIRAGEAAGADLLFLETFSDLNELRAAVLAAKECSALPVFASMTFEASGRTFLGCTPDAAAMTLSGLGVDALGINCSLGAEEAAPILRAMRSCTDLPLLFKPNAGLPDPQTGEYAADPQSFAQVCAKLTDIGAAYLGGCCGTTPDFIRALKTTVSGKKAVWNQKHIHGVCSARKVCPLGQGVKVIGERLNPTGKKQLADALINGNMQVFAAQAIEQAEAGADILDVNVGLPGIDEAEAMRNVITALSGVVDLPLQIDASDPAVIEAGLRAAPGKCIINSVNASDSSLASILPLAKKYGAAVIGLTMDAHGLPADCEARMQYARKIVRAAKAIGISKEDILIDCLALTVSAQQSQIAETLKAVHTVREELGLETVLGISNISFGLPERALIAQAFLCQALAAGLTLPILNPNNKRMMDALSACRVLSGEDAGCTAYIERHSAPQSALPASSPNADLSIEDAVARGLKDEAALAAKKLLPKLPPLAVVDQYLIPALDRVGEAYESGKIFLPQLMNAAAASGAAFDEIHHALEKTDANRKEKGPILLATVQGDIHDIGKNIVAAVLENYGFRVIDLGRDVSPECIAEMTKKYHAKLIGLSALMTSTLPSMKKTIAYLRKKGCQVPIMVGGAVLTPECAKAFGADYYAKDAKQSADIAKSIL